MAKNATIRARIEPELKAEVEKLFKELGLSTTEAINLFYRQVKLRNGLPFNVVIANKTTEKFSKIRTPREISYAVKTLTICSKS